MRREIFLRFTFLGNIQKHFIMSDMLVLKFEFKHLVFIYSIWSSAHCFFWKMSVVDKHFLSAFSVQRSQTEINSCCCSVLKGEVKYKLYQSRTCTANSQMDYNKTMVLKSSLRCALGGVWALMICTIKTKRITSTMLCFTVFKSVKIQRRNELYTRFKKYNNILYMN